MYIQLYCNPVYRCIHVQMYEQYSIYGTSKLGPSKAVLLFSILPTNIVASFYFDSQDLERHSRWWEVMIRTMLASYPGSAMNFLTEFLKQVVLAAKHRAVIKGRGLGIFPLYFEVYPRLLWYKISMLTSLHVLTATRIPGYFS